MIPVVHGSRNTKARTPQRVGGLIRYLYGPGKREEHIDPRIIAAWEGVPRVDLLEPTSRGRWADCRRLISALEEPIAFGVRPPQRQVWHASIRAAPEDRILSDAQWAHIAREFMNATGLAKYGDYGAVRWVAIRHNDDHIHIAATLVRQDGKRASTWNDWYNARATARDIEERYGLRRTGPADRTAARRPHPVELNKASHRAGSHDTARDQLRRIVRQAAALAADEHDFFTRLDTRGLVVRQRESELHPAEITGYSVGLPTNLAADGRPVFFSGGRLAADLTLPKLRQRWGGPGDVIDPERLLGRPQRPGPGRTTDTRPSRRRLTREERVAALRQAAAKAQQAAAQIRANPATAQPTAQAAADLLRAAAYGMEGRRGGPLSAAADQFDRASRDLFGRTAMPSRRSYDLRAVARLIGLMGQISGDRETFAILELMAKLAVLSDALEDLRRSQLRLHQARDANAAATGLRRWRAGSGRRSAAAAAVTPTTPPTMGPDRRHGRRH
jgi:hypothetical protein